MPPPYVPLSQSDPEAAAEIVPRKNDEDAPAPVPVPIPVGVVDGTSQWSSGICACCDDMQSCCVGLLFPCFLFGRNAEFLGSGTFVGSCITHFILWALLNTFCCFLTDGILLGLPGCFVACYACGYRRALRTKYNLQEAPCGDFVTHFFCHLCAVCQEYREICERAGDSYPPSNLVEITPPPPQTMESISTE